MSRKKNDSKTNQRSFFFKDYSYKSNDEFKKIRLNIGEDRVYLLFFVFFSLILIFAIKIFSTSLKEPNFRNNQNYYTTIFKPLRSDIVDKDGTRKVPVMLHRALFGSLERFIGILIENYSGKLPFWIAPQQVMVIPVSEEFDSYAKKVSKEIRNIGINSEIDLKNHNLNYKIREHSLAKIPILLICGKKEVDSNSVTIRRLDSNKQENMELKTFLKKFSALNKAPSN